MNIIDLVDLLIMEEEEQEESLERIPLYIENIRPQDLPPNDSPFPSPPPHKRVIILDI